MWKRFMVRSLAVVSLAAVGILGPTPASEVEAACWRCNGCECEGGGDGVWCKEMHFPNGSCVCESQDGCNP